jgi:SH3-like domain-containing protein
MAAMLPVRALCLLAGGLLSAAAVASDYRSVAVHAAILYDAPSQQGRKLWLAPRFSPLEVVSTVNQWVKVRDASGDLAWVERGDLSAARTVVTRLQASVRSAGQEGAEVLFTADRGVALELLDPALVSGWVRVRHRDGTAGWVRAADVWGL